MRVVLYEPEVPPNTGNIARLCAAFDVELHLIEPLGFSLDNRYLKRAGLDYWPHVRLAVWPSWDAFLANDAARGSRLVMATTRASSPLQAFQFNEDDDLIFGPETRGLPDAVLDMSPWRVRVPVRRMERGGVRSLNLSTACGIILYAALASTNALGRFA